MDPYEFTQTVRDDSQQQEMDNDELKRLEKELTPTSADYYGVLNISKKATEEEIKEAYKKLCRFFHPDKHTDEAKKKMAESRFQVIQKAYEVLCNPQKRIIYDTYGEEGLNATWDIGPRYKTTEELREEYEKLARQKREQELENLVQSKAEFQLTVDATQVFDPYEPPVFVGFGQPLQSQKKKRKNPLSFLAKAQAQQLFMRHSFQTQIGPQTHAIVSGSMVSRTGMGGGNIIGTIRHTVSPKLWGEITATTLKPRMISLKSYYSLSQDSFINSSAQVNSIYEPPILSVSLGRRLFSATTGYITYRTGEWSLFGWGGDISQKMDRSSVSLGLAGMHKRSNHFSGEIQTGIMSSHIAGEYTYKLPHQARLRLSCTLSSQGGIMASIGSDHKVSQHVRAGMSMECGSGIIVKFRVSRLGQKIVLPIILSSEFDLRLAFLGAVIPASVAVALDQLILKPRRKRLIKQKIDELREEHSEYLENRKQEALDAQLLMADIAERKKKQEEKKKDGLVIVKAWYGHLDNTSEEEVIDVSIVIQTLVHESRLTIPGGHSKSSILGFYDPCLGEKKQLRVQYRFRHRLHQVTVEDTAALICPAQAHLLNL